MKTRAAAPLLSLIGVIASAAPAAGPSAAEEASSVKLERAYGLLKTGRLDEAAELLRGVARSDPSARQARMELAYLQLRRRRWPEAVALLGSLLDENPADMRLRMELGYARLALGDRAAAADEFALAAREPGEFQAQAQGALNSLAAESSEAAVVARSEALLNEGYADLRRADKPAAREKFLQALRSDPGRTLISKQLGYMSIADGDKAAAASRFEGVRRLAPDDHQTALELGYLYESLHDEAAAEKSFAAALPSPDPSIRAAARDSLDAVRGRGDPLYADVDAAAYGTSRFANKIVSIDARAGWKPDPAGPLAVYFAARYTQDSRSRGGEAPEIYSDDAVSFAPGLRFQPKGWNASLSAEWGGTVNLLRSRERPDKTQADGRAVLAGYRYWRGPRRTFADAGFNIGYYSRYRDNVIGQLLLRAGVKAWDNRSSQLTLYAPLSALKDANRDFYNNIVELGAGLEVQPSTKRNLKVRAEYLRGAYTGIEGRDPNPYGPRYDVLRVMLVYSAHFTRRRRPANFEPTRRRRFAW